MSLFNKTELKYTIKTFFEYLEKINENLVSCSKSLKNISNINLNQSDDDYWHNLFDLNAELPPENTWVLVKICDINAINIEPYLLYGVPHIAEFRNGQWFAEEWDGPYETNQVPFKVLCWRPIPGTSKIKIYADGGEMERWDITTYD